MEHFFVRLFKPNIPISNIYCIHVQFYYGENILLALPGCHLDHDVGIENVLREEDPENVVE